MKVIALILGGGEGSRLLPLTRDRAKPAVPVGGKYRLVDIPISNCINSDIRKIFLLTQFNSVSLHDHIQLTYKFDPFQQNFVRLLAAQQTPGSEAWYTGTADAVRKTFSHYLDEQPDIVVILSGDQLYRMDFEDVIQQHIDNKADVTISTKPVERRDAGDLGIMQIDKNKQIINFVEKPGDGVELDPLRAPLYDEERFLASMGIYIFNTRVLSKLLEDESKSDFGKHIIPKAIHEYKVCSYIFDDYWRDIGTIRNFWEANLSLTDPLPEFDFYKANAPIYTHMRYLPPSKINRCYVERSLLSEGCIISGNRISHSLVGIRATVGDETMIEDSVFMGADFYEKADDRDTPLPGLPGVGIGRNCHIRNAIIDKNVRIGDNVTISPDGKEDETSTDQYSVRGGIIVIPKNTVIPSDTVL